VSAIDDVGEGAGSVFERTRGEREVSDERDSD